MATSYGEKFMGVVFGFGCFRAIRTIYTQENKQGDGPSENISRVSQITLD